MNKFEKLIANNPTAIIVINIPRKTDVKVPYDMHVGLLRIIGKMNDAEWHGHKAKTVIVSDYDSKLLHDSFLIQISITKIVARDISDFVFDLTDFSQIDKWQKYQPSIFKKIKSWFR